MNSGITQVDRRLGYKVRDKDGEEQTCYRWSEAEQAWTSTATPLPFTVQEADLPLWLGLWAFVPGWTVTPTACCCVKCATPEAKAFWQTQNGISHGYWPECLPAMLDYYTAEMATISQAGGGQAGAGQTN